MTNEAQLLEQGRLGRRHVGGRGIAVEITKQGQQSAHERRIGVAAKAAAAVPQLGDEPGLGDAAPHPMGIVALGRVQRRTGPGAINDRGEPLLGIVDDRVVVDQLLLLGGQGHVPDAWASRDGLQAARRAFKSPVMELSALGWFWRGLQGHSVTFAALFASVILGLSISGGVGKLLAALGVHWLYVLLLPAVIFWWLNRQEPRWLPDPVKRKWLARAVLLGAGALAVVINQIKH